LKARLRVHHSFPISGTAQTCVIAEVPSEFLLSGWASWCNWHWRPVCTGQVDRLARTVSEDEESIRNYFQMDEIDLSDPEADKSDNDEDGFATENDDCSTHCGDSIAGQDRDASQANSAASTAQQRCDETTWLEDAAQALSREEVQNLVQRYNVAASKEWRVPTAQPASHECQLQDASLDTNSSTTAMTPQRCRDPEWVKKRGGRARLAAYLRGISLPAFKPSWTCVSEDLPQDPLPPPLPPPASPPSMSSVEPSPAIVQVSRQRQACVSLLHKARAEDSFFGKRLEKHATADPIASPTIAPVKPIMTAPAELEPAPLEVALLHAIADHRRLDKRIGEVDDAEWEVVDGNRHGKPSIHSDTSAVRLWSKSVLRKPTEASQKSKSESKASQKSNSEYAKANATNTSAVEQATVMVFQGEIKARKLPMKFGFIEVSGSHRKALRAHPLWTLDMEVDVFWHSKDCDYLAQRAGDIVKFTVSLKPDGLGRCLQAKNVALVARISER